ncbi:unnamed protein product [Arctia plantaginis]|uniref:Uncharacterized protein n=1 Tax=Arctia plantaginis TaxID=874455 RepID=A0A8S1BCB9_ARCPL|nr:unnamed protein product [Arctia plantaginis]
MILSDEERTSEEPSEETKEVNAETIPRITVNMDLTTIERVSSSKKGRAQVIFINTRQKILDMKENQTQVRNATKKTRFSIQKSGPEGGETNKPKYLLPYTDEDINNFTMTPTTLLSTKRIRNEYRPSTGTSKNMFDKLELNNARTTTMTTGTMKEKIKNSQGMMFILGDQIYSNLSKVTNNVQFYHISDRTLVAPNKKSNKTDIMLMMESESASDEGEEDKSSKGSSDEGKLLAKDIARTSILRKEYGDACLKLVVRKCYKACKSALKAVCRHAHCKADFKVVYNKKYKESCDTLFADVALRTADQINENSHGYLTTVCQPPQPNTPKLAQRTEPTTNTTAYERNLHILRVRYEKACIKTSREKCKDACTFSYTKACENNKCKKKKLDNFSKECSRQCKIAFKFEGKKKSSSSSSSSDSDADSDDDDDDDK